MLRLADYNVGPRAPTGTQRVTSDTLCHIDLSALAIPAMSFAYRAGATAEGVKRGEAVAGARTAL